MKRIIKIITYSKGDKGKRKRVFHEIFNGKIINIDIFDKVRKTGKANKLLPTNRKQHQINLEMALRTLVTRKSVRSGFEQIRGLQTGVTLPDLVYDYGALEPAISGEIMKLHHQKHHQTYVTNYNKALEQLDAAVSKSDSTSIAKLHSALKFNGGG